MELAGRCVFRARVDRGDQPGARQPRPQPTRRSLSRRWRPASPATRTAQRAGTTTPTVSVACADPAHAGRDSMMIPTSATTSPIRPLRPALFWLPLLRLAAVGCSATAHQSRASGVPRIRPDCQRTDSNKYIYFNCLYVFLRVSTVAGGADPMGPSRLVWDGYHSPRSRAVRASVWRGRRPQFA